ncbi:MAG: lysophospholipid acyltransferase family protein [Phaeodactylibacter sp.]|nr:lysophospholipid acyltransferase family protein [Phaeodactylibacter sp.]MCB9275690.1 lysophospholipid acyltransferase family protein [Lewinellaceae bacterium]
MFSTISRFILTLLGWKIVPEYDQLPEKYVFIAIPHTSNWDFPLGLLARSALGLDIKYVGKSSLFKPPFGWLFRWLGGYPVDRSRSTNYVDSVVDIFEHKQQFAICIAPEGTRKKVSELKTGFYYIALGSRAPIVMGRLDWGRKEVRISKPFYPAGDKDADFRFILQYFQGAKGKHPELGLL